MSLLHATVSLAFAAGGLALQHASAGALEPVQQLLSKENLTGTEAGDPNLCIHNRLAPQFFLIGVPRSGQARFYKNFVSSPGIVKFSPKSDEPAWHEQEPWIFADGFDLGDTDEWLSHYPACDRSKRMVAIDCTPGYFGDTKTPWAIANVYRTAGVTHMLQFMVLLRDPVMRLHSHYYHYVDDGVLKDALPDCPSSVFPSSFYSTVKNMLEKNTICNCPCDNLITDSKYAASFKRYFANFFPEQFHVVPFDRLDKQVVKYAWDMLGVPHGQLVDEHRVVEDIAPHPDMVTELDEVTLLQLESYMDRVSGAEELVSLWMGTGIKLYGYGDDIHDGAKVAQWLRTSWGREF